MLQHKLLATLSEKYNDLLRFEPAKTYYWSPKDSTVFYQDGDKTDVGLWTLLHEASHGLLKHKTYESDFELVLLEVGAWEKAGSIAKELKIAIDEEHVQDCLDSYRDWQYKRSLCPNCDLGGVQLNQKTYECLFCGNNWQVSSARFCRPYRRRTSSSH
ncbi:MAG: hypothetical protein ACI9T8_000610 [Candidatus Saccharimonadales bacterium]|jgi:hypothetical protein